MVPQRMRSALQYTNFILQPLIDKTTKILRSGAPRIKVDEGELVECKIVIFFAPSGMLSPSRDRRDEEEWERDEGWGVLP